MFERGARYSNVDYRTCDIIQLQHISRSESLGFQPAVLIKKNKAQTIYLKYPTGP